MSADDICHFLHADSVLRIRQSVILRNSIHEVLEPQRKKG